MTLSEQLTALATALNLSLEANGREERWELDTDSCSNSVGTWSCGNVGGVTDATSMMDYTFACIVTPGMPALVPQYPIPSDQGLRGDVTIEDVTARLNAELAAAREANAALREALGELLESIDTFVVDCPFPIDTDSVRPAQAKARKALR